MRLKVSWKGLALVLAAVLIFGATVPVVDASVPQRYKTLLDRIKNYWSVDSSGNLTVPSVGTSSCAAGSGTCGLNSTINTTDPSNPAANTTSLYPKDDGSGLAWFYKASTGAVKQLATTSGAASSMAVDVFGLSATKTDAVAAASDGQCTCFLFTLASTISDLDTVVYQVQATDADDTAELGIYSASGATQYFEDTVTTTIQGTTGTKTATNDTAAPGAMTPGDYLFCWSRADGGDTNDYNLGGESNLYGSVFTQACASAEMPATLTSPTESWGARALPLLTLIDE